MNRYAMRVAAALMAVGIVAGGSAVAQEKLDGHSDRAGFGSRLKNGYDPCWMERYGAVARQEVLSPFAQQALNGHIMNHTLWNYHFESGTDRLTPAGIEKLDSLVRSRPAPDPKIFLQTSRDLAATADTIDKLAESRIDLDSKRAAAVARYMATQPRQIPFEVFVHDPTDMSINSTAAGNAFRASLLGYRGGISGSGAGVAQGAGGGSGGSPSAASAPAGTQGTNPSAPGAAPR